MAKKDYTPPEEYKYKVLSKEVVMVPARDGVKLAVNIFRPKAEGKFPALVAVSGYGKDLQDIPQFPQGHIGQDGKNLSLVWDGVLEAGDTKRIVGRGYVHVVADARGCGDSEGVHVGMCDPVEGRDNYDIIEWVAAQDWCDGNVGMIGISYFAQSQVVTAAEQPPHLKAIFPWEVWYDLYRQTATDEGVINPMIYRLYSGRHMDPGPTHGSGYAPRNCVSATFHNMPPEEADKLWKERLADPDIMKYTIYWSCLRYPFKSPFFADFMLQQHDGPFYWERTPYKRLDKIKVPTYVGGPPIDLWAKGCCYIYDHIDVPKKMIMGPGDERPWYQTHDEVLRWMDYWVKGIDNGIMDEPPIRIFTTGINEWRNMEQFPQPNTEWTKFYLRSRGRLMTEAPIFDEGPDAFVQQPIDQTNDVARVVYTSETLTHDMEIGGSMCMYLYGAIDQENTNWQVKLFDIDEYGIKRFMLTEDWLKASRRAIDESLSRPEWPWHPHLKDEPCEPGKVYEYRIGLAPKSHVFKAGHRIEIQIASLDDTLGGLHICSSRTTLHKVYHNTEYASYMLLPVVK